MSAPALVDCVTDGVLRVRVTTKASADRIRIEERPGGTPLVRVDVTIVPEKGKANEAVLSLLAKALGRPKSGLAIVQGETSRDKVVRVTG